jgi:hypothetical protein
MTTRLRDSIQIRRLAADLGLRDASDSVTAIRDHCQHRLREFMVALPCTTLSDLLEVARDRLGTIFIDIHSDVDLDDTIRRYVGRREFGFADLAAEFAGEVLAVTIRLLHSEPWELPFVSVIDCRGAKSRRAYYSKWHELAHLLTLTDQRRLKFCRTHGPGEESDPEERLMELIAGDGAYLTDVVAPHASGPVSFSAIEDLRDRLCPESSDQAARIGFVQGWPSPCLLLQGMLALRKAEARGLRQGRLGFLDGPEAALRAVEITASPGARRSGLVIPRNMRIPKDSVIYSTYLDGEERESLENLEMWSASNGRSLAPQPVRVEARRIYDGVVALLAPADH